ncbi:MAG: hypothetical protein KF700_02090 [Hyphomonadaceae bacterium]|nr:hypothetical protein [Hyphomonadaceae bacterium]
MKSARAIALSIAAAALSACATLPSSAPGAPTGSSTIPSTPLDLGDWRRASVSATLQHFQSQVSARYGVGLTFAAVTADLRNQGFTCAPPRTDGRGDPPSQVCRQTQTASGCTHTWQVLLFDENSNARLARTRGLYDRSCANDGLLGGPG